MTIIFGNDQPLYVQELSDGGHTLRITVDHAGRITVAIETDTGAYGQLAMNLDTAALTGLINAALDARRVAQRPRYPRGDQHG